MKKTCLYTEIFQDENIIAVNKASGISVGGDRWDESKERLDRTLERDYNLSRIFTVHRIDKDTSGLVVFARNRENHRSLSIAFENRQVVKKYIAVVHGRPSWKETVCDLPLVPDGNKKHMTIIDRYQGKESVTRFVLVTCASCKHGNYSVLEAYPQTGRIHQIRVHAASLGHPVVCDNLYGSEKPVFLSSFKRNWRGDPCEEKPLLSRLGLHAMEITLPDVNSGIKFTAPLAKDISSLIKQLEKN
ncbi:MAG: RluA family pseudouridine synthase [Treponema sp.]|nr:RluA family pseudouridine synthase [Treponema sp.]